LLTILFTFFVFWEAGGGGCCCCWLLGVVVVAAARQMYIYNMNQTVQLHVNYLLKLHV
jgi:hypothetical protein